MKKIADTGLLKAALDRNDEFHKWGAREFQAHAPFITCEAVLVELSFFLSPAAAMLLLQRGDVTLDFNLGEETEQVLDLLERYKDRPMDLADACLVRMTELHPQSKVWTVDREDFAIYRRNRRQPVPHNAPPKT